MNFITLPSGVRINTSHIIGYRDSDSKTVRIVHSILGIDGKLLEFEEDMTAAELDNLLRGPAVTSPVLELRLPKIDEAVSFPYCGKILHGVVVSLHLSTGDGDYTNAIISSGMKKYRYFPDSNKEPEMLCLSKTNQPT